MSEQPQRTEGDEHERTYDASGPSYAHRTARAECKARGVRTFEAFEPPTTEPQLSTTANTPGRRRSRPRHQRDRHDRA